MSNKATIRNIPLSGKRPCANMREVTTADGSTVILVSYHTPVAYKTLANKTSEWEYFRCKEYYSVTTSKHINAWLGREGAYNTASEIPQANISALCPVVL